MRCGYGALLLSLQELAALQQAGLLLQPGACCAAGDAPACGCRDTECHNTVADLFRKAAFPERVFIGAVDQARVAPVALCSAARRQASWLCDVIRPLAPLHMQACLFS